MIRHATNTDFRELADIYHDASLIAHPFIDPAYIALDKVALREDRLPLQEAFLYEYPGEIAGYISLTGPHINGLFVTVSRQRQGIGRALIEHAKQLHDHLDVRVFQENYSAQRFYYALGFDVLEERSHPQLPHDEYLMHWPE